MPPKKKAVRPPVVEEQPPQTSTSILAAPQPSSPPRRTGFYSRLLRFFTFYEPSQIPIITQWLQNWENREDELMHYLVSYHGPEPGLSGVPASGGQRVAPPAGIRTIEECRTMLRNLYVLYFPERYAEMDVTLSRWKGRETELLERLQIQLAQQEFVLRVFSEHFPDRMGEAALLLRQWVGNEEELVQHLSRSISLPPPAAGPIVGPPAPAGGMHGTLGGPGDAHSPASLKKQLQQFYRVYNPEHLSRIDEILHLYKDTPHLLFPALRKKYGLPEVDTPSGKKDVSLSEAELASNYLGPVTPDMKSKILILACAWRPDRVADVERLIEEFHGTEGQLIRKLVALTSTTGADLLDSMVGDNAPPTSGEDTDTASAAAFARLVQRYNKNDEATQTPVSFLHPSNVRSRSPQSNIHALEADVQSAAAIQADINNRVSEIARLADMAGPPVVPPPSVLLSSGSGAKGVMHEVWQQRQVREKQHKLSCWLEERGLSFLYPILVREDITDLATLRSVSEYELQVMGVSPYDVRRTVLEAIATIPPQQ